MSQYVYGAVCTWHGPIEETTLIGRPGIEIPGCPHCGGVLYQLPDRVVWEGGLKRFAAQNPDVPHYERFIASLNSPCRPLDGWDWRAAYHEWVKTWKDGLELNYWTMAADLLHHRKRLFLYLEAWKFHLLPGRFRTQKAGLEIGCGPLGGVLPMFNWVLTRRVGVDPNVDEYRGAGLLTGHELNGIEFVSARFEDWETEEHFDAIFSADSLDHGTMGFHLIPRIAGLLNPGGRFYLHVHIRTPEQLNETHDHALTVAQLDDALGGTSLVELHREVHDNDLDGFPLRALVGVWELP
jgi:hypothetical protein